jgi:uncharacterized membrane protein YczE
MRVATFLGIIVFALLYGYVANIVHLVNTEHLTGMVIARAIGVFLAPLGIALGFL